MAKRSFFISPFIFMACTSLYGQLNGYNLTEFQFGNIPDTQPADRNTLYNQFNLLYRQENLKIKLRTEQYVSNDTLNNDFIALSQVSANYKVDKFMVSGGNLYESLGRGLLLRSYEVTGSVYENQIYRVKHAFYRDLMGVSTAYHGKSLKMKLLHGKVLNNLLPPDNDQRRLDFVSAIETEYKIFNQTIGGRAMRLDLPQMQQYYGSLSLAGSIPLFGNYYAEWAQGQGQALGMYASLSHYYGSFGFTAEYKIYENLLIGTGISDPPNLVKEHSYKLLNRSTHVTSLSQEEGYQLEAYYTFSNNSLADFQHCTCSERTDQGFCVQ
jgi:hypothetical protein